MTDTKTAAEQAALIRKSVKEWNAWRDASLSDASLSDADLRGANLSDANLSGANLRDADLRDADLRGANLSGANLSGAYLSGANLNGANLNGANLRDAGLRGANLSWAVKVEGLICRVYRSDDHLFLAFTTNRGIMIKAGCRLLSPADYRIHAAKTYPDTKKAVETLRIIQYIEDCAKEQE